MFFDLMVVAGGKSSKVGLGVGIISFPYKRIFMKASNAERKSQRYIFLPFPGIGIAGAAAVCIGLGCWLLLIRQRRKRIAAQTKSKGQPTPPSSKGEPAPIINFSQTTPTYPSLNSDLEKGSTYFGTRVFSYEELVEATDNFNPSKELGDGGFGTVYYGQKMKPILCCVVSYTTQHQMLFGVTFLDCCFECFD